MPQTMSGLVQQEKSGTPNPYHGIDIAVLALEGLKIREYLKIRGRKREKHWRAGSSFALTFALMGDIRLSLGWSDDDALLEAQQNAGIQRVHSPPRNRTWTTPSLVTLGGRF